MLDTGKMAFNLASGLMVRPSLSLYFLMYTQIFFVTSVRGMVLPPQIAANASLSFFGAKIPTPFFFMASAFFLPDAFIAVFVAFVIVVFVVVVVTVIAIVGLKCTHAL